ncbi:hypothetical protein OSG_eHP25_00025 [environmental Halophage eHP-25]|nr:hypothetical protein OSG_eHP25_00025 [environmental Halophage eHP-25]
MASTESNLIQTLYERLTGTDAYGTALTYEGNEVTVVTGNKQSDDSSPVVILDRPRTRGKKFLDGHNNKNIRQQIRISTEFSDSGADHLDAYDIAEEVQSLLEADAITVENKDLFVEEADKQPLPPQSQGDKTAFDIVMQFFFSI